MTTNIFKNLRNHYQILDRILVYLPEKFEKCYLGKTTTLFTAGLRLPLMTLHRQLANFLRLFVSQVTPNAWRIFIGAKILWGRLSGGNHQLSLDKFFWCYRPQHIISSQGIYYFVVRKKELRLVSNMPDSNRNWKGRYFFVQGTDWVCCPKEWVTMPYGFDNTWGIVKDSGLAPLVFSFTSFVPIFQPVFVRT